MGKVLFLGVAGSGKSALTASLVRCLEGDADSEWSLRPENKEAFLFSSRVVPALAEGTFPVPTTVLKNMKWSLVCRDESYYDLEILDYPGEVYGATFLDPEEQESPEDLIRLQEKYAAEISSLMRFLTSAERIFLLVDLDNAANSEVDDRNVDAVWVTTAALKCIKSLLPRPEITVLITRTDRLVAAGVDVSDPMALLRRCVPLLASHFVGMDVRFVSATDSEGAASVLKSIFVDALRNSDRCRAAMPRWREYARRCYEGLPPPADEREIVETAKVFAPFLEEARFAAHMSESYRRLNLVKNTIVGDMSKMSGGARRRFLISMLAQENDPGIRRFIQTRVDSERDSLVAVFFVVLALVLLVLVTIIGSLHN